MGDNYAILKLNCYINLYTAWRMISEQYSFTQGRVNTLQAFSLQQTVIFMQQFCSVSSTTSEYKEFWPVQDLLYKITSLVFNSEMKIYFALTGIY